MRETSYANTLEALSKELILEQNILCRYAWSSKNILFFQEQTLSGTAQSPKKRSCSGQNPKPRSSKLQGENNF